jgi:Peptidase family M23/Alpha/beta hydrolase of unknown function (DUF900)
MSGPPRFGRLQLRPPVVASPVVRAPRPQAHRVTSHHGDPSHAVRARRRFVDRESLHPSRGATPSRGAAPRAIGHRVHLLAAALVVVVAVVSLATASASAAVSYVPPVDAPIVDHFRPPSVRWGPGNRGIDYQVAPGTAVRASAAGVVTFAGQVGGDLHVVVLHADGLRTSSSFLASITVHRGQRVDQGQVLGTSGDTVHFGVRSGDTYLDPELLFAGLLHITALATDGQLPAERLSHIIALLQREQRWYERVIDVVVDGGRQAGQAASELAIDIGNGVERTIEQVDAIGGDLAFGFIGIGTSLVEWLVQPCTARGTATPTSLPPDDVVIVVAGLGSSSTSGAGIDGLDLATLGIDPANVIRASYNGGRIPANRSGAPPATDLAGLSTSDYTEADSTQDMRTSAANVARLVDDVARLRPNARIHLIAHSQGGVVAVEALRTIEAIANVDVVTISSPHQGATLATVGVLFETIAPDTAADIGEAAQDSSGWDPTATSVRQLASTSGFMDHYWHDPRPQVPITSIGCWNDLIVPSSQVDLAGSQQVILRTAANPVAAHGAVVADPLTTVEVARALHGQAPTCQTFADMALGVVVGNVIAGTELVGGSTVAVGVGAVSGG